MTLDYKITHTLRVLTALLAVVFTIGGIHATALAASRAHSEMQIVLDPDSNRLRATVTTRWNPDGAVQIAYRLSPKATDLRILLDGRSIDYRFENRTLLIDTAMRDPKQPLILTIQYACRFDDPIPQMPANTDNPGYGVTASIGPQGTLLLAGAGWYPEPLADLKTYRVLVDAPAGILAVTAGRLMGHSTASGRTRSEWHIDQPVRGLALSAARYVVQTRSVGKITAATYFFEDSQHLVATYLDAVERYLTLYQDLFGPYPFDKFAVVENFFPTGYGFPSYTLLGRRVLRLPFIPYTSLGHEIAHCWWGNGVYVDFAQGNWSEGLTTYVADYYFKELRSPAEALDYRRQWLRDYSTLVDDKNDFPLSRFMSRVDPVTKTIGYDKCAMVFHMVRTLVGDDAFWETLRDVYRQNLFKTVSWDDWRGAFENRSGLALKPFFTQWINSVGAPRPAFGDLTIEQNSSGYVLSGSVVQTEPYFTFAADMQLETAAGDKLLRLQISGRKTRFEYPIGGLPKRLVFDPDVDLMRRLYPDEIPPTINSIKGAGQVAIVVADNLDSGAEKTARLLAEALGLRRVQIVNEADTNLKTAAGQDLILFGRPSRPRLLSVLEQSPETGIRKTVLEGDPAANPGDITFGVFSNPKAAGRIVATFWPADSPSAQIVARKITHYGKYSYLVFRNGRNLEKGVWPVTESPLIYNWR